MSSTEQQQQRQQRIYVIGGTGNTGVPVVKKLLRNDAILVTLLARSADKAQQLFGSPSNLTVVEGNYSNQDLITETIKGHARLFLLVHDPTAVQRTRVGRNIAETAYASGVEQIVTVTGTSTAEGWRSSFYGYSAREYEDAILSIPNRGSLVTLRPTYFMSNHLTMDVFTINKANKIMGTRNSTEKEPWISPNDIGLLAANVLQDPVEKHGDAVYEMIGEVKTPDERAALLTRILGRNIHYEQITHEQSYEFMVNQGGMPHLLAYGVLQMTDALSTKLTPGLSILLGRAPETLEQYFEQNKSVWLV